MWWSIIRSCKFGNPIKNRLKINKNVSHGINDKNVEEYHGFLKEENAHTRDLTAFELTSGASEGSALKMDLSSGAAFLTKGCSKSWAAVGRYNGLRCKHSFTKAFPSSDRWSGISGSSLLFPILNMAATFEETHNRREKGANNQHLACNSHQKIGLFTYSKSYMQ